MGQRLAGMAALAAFAAAGPLPAAGPEWLCLSPTHGGGTVMRLATGPEGEFALSFIHSVSKTPVTDLYRLTDGRIVQIAEIFEAHGAGLPSVAAEVGATGWRHENGRFILDLARPTGPIALRIQAEYANTLHVAGSALPLARLGLPALTLAPCPKEKSP
ncbi:DUF1850 domain-containing protein [Tropicimonas sp.]|uniref:DUF1850 domain-containing protein n=1 Tax=Tropicimonas sp. TaxID=2067044 RepID=UPI003A8465FB